MNGKQATMPELPAGVDRTIVIQPITEIAGVTIPEDASEESQEFG